MARNRDLAKLPYELIGGLAGYILAKATGTDYDFEWIENFTSRVEHDVKANGAMSKGNAVYISSADGTNMIATKADYSTDGTSSKTIGLLKQTLANNGIGRVITEGLLTGTGSAPLNTSTATAGDPVWLGANGALIFGAANKPHAPLHMVFLGIVTRAHSINGEIFVKVQNGFELEELHNVSAQSPNNRDIIRYNNSTKLWENKPFGWYEVVLTDADFVAANDTRYFLPAGILSQNRIVNISAITSRVSFVIAEDAFAYRLIFAGGTVYEYGGAESTDGVMGRGVSVFELINGKLIRTQ